MAETNPYLINRDNWWHYSRRVPKHVADLDTRGCVRIATKVRVLDDPSGKRASKIADRLDAATEAYWGALVAGRGSEARTQLVLATKRALQLGMTFIQTATEVATLSAVEAILARVETLSSRANPDDKVDVIAALGATSTVSGIMLSQLPTLYETHCAVENKKKNEDQLRKWNNRNKACINNLITAIGGDKDIMLVDRADGQTFRKWWAQRILDEHMSNGGANKDIWGVGKMIRTIAEANNLKDPASFAGLGFEKDDGQREAFEPEFVRDVICNPASFATMNSDAFDVTLVMVETGARPSEIVALDEHNIHLDAPVPYISVTEEGREVKTRASIRDVPLTGVALEAMRRNPKGFPRYFQNADAVSALVNKHLKKLQPNVNEEKGDTYKTMYGIRHCFKDRMRAALLPDSMMDAIMGHDEGTEQGNKKKPKYGTVYKLETKLEALRKIAFT